MKRFKNQNFLILFFISLSLILPVYSYKPLGTYAHSTALVDNKLYVIGGIDLSAVSVTFKNVFYLDLGTSFKVESPSWVDLSTDSSTPFYSGWTTAAVGGSDNKIIYLFGGVQYDVSHTDAYSGFTWQFDTTSNTWSQPSFSGTEPTRRREMDAVSDANGKIYIFSGIYDTVLGASVNKRIADMIIVGTIDKDYAYGSTTGIPLGRIDYTATILSNGVIVYIGGWDGGMLSYSSLSTYDTTTDTWANVTASGTSSLETRYGHSAVLTTDGRIIVYGGLNFNGYTPSPILIVLDTNTFKWSSPSTSGSPEAEPVIYHSADIYDKYMIIAFGNLTSTTTDPTGPSSQIYILDVDKYNWISSYTSSATTTTPDKPNGTSGPYTSTTSGSDSGGLSSKAIGIIVAVCVGSVGVCILIIAALCIGFKKFVKKPKDTPQPYRPPQHQKWAA
ncbi:hypothetical protein Glove_227g163 [Diversispora epigaea]|uniref:Galactose oxidase n=1 Tax=Diversispora epigaea TaxID=1348612 RepID=A0A397IDY6_9GLOM|nr:hypothetical protein Glove_227g163 [Diversispora epigaea]